jgi:hypothetical protein
MQQREAILAPEIESDTAHHSSNSTTRSQHFHSVTAICTVRPVVVWQVVRDVTCCCVARFIALRSAFLKNRIKYLILFTHNHKFTPVTSKTRCDRGKWIAFLKPVSKISAEMTFSFQMSKSCRVV